MKIEKNKVFTLFALTLLIASLIFVNLNVSPITSQAQSITRYLHKEESLEPVHLHKEEPLQPVHIHPVSMVDPTDPLGSMWHELYPIFSNEYYLTSWNDTNGDGELSPSDQIDLTNLDTGEKIWYHLDRVTWTLNITEVEGPPSPPPAPPPMPIGEPMYAELVTPPKVIPQPIGNPIGTTWHVVHPPWLYSHRFNITSWEDNLSGELDFCDYIDVEYWEEPGHIYWYHVEEVVMDLILTKKCLYDDVGSLWRELYPTFSQYYSIDRWNDTDQSGMLTYTDEIDLHVDWPKFHHDNPSIGYSVSTAPNTNTTLWKYNTTKPVFSSPAIVDNILYIGATDNNTYALNATTGVQIWNYTTGGPIRSSPAVFYGNVYILSTDGFLYALNDATGALVWSTFIDFGPTPWSSPAVTNGRVFIADSSGWIICLDAFTGAFIWSTFVGGQPNGPITVVNNKVFSGTHNYDSSNATLVALDELTGALIWTYNYTQSVPGVTGMVNSNGAAVTDGDGDGNLEVYFGICTWNASTGLATGPGEAIALHESNGTEIWRYSFLNVTGVGGMGPGWSTSTPAVHGGKVFIGSDDQNIYALNAATGAKVWNYTTGAAVWSAPAVADGKVFAGALDHILYALNETTGTLIWSYNTSQSRIYGSPAVACGKVFVASQNGNVIAFGTQESKPRWYHVDRVTLTLKLKDESTRNRMYAELKYEGPWETMYEAIMNPVHSKWHVVYPSKNYSSSFNITWWVDNGDGVLSFCDYIWVLYEGETMEYLYHVEEIACDIILTKKCFYDPVGSQWHELYPEFCNDYYLDDWEDTNWDSKLSPSDNIYLKDIHGDIAPYHVDNVTLTILVQDQSGFIKYLEFEIGDAPIEVALAMRAKPLFTLWHEVHPIFSNRYMITNWTDNCNGVLDFCDDIELTDEDQGAATWWHVLEIACDIQVTGEEPPPLEHDVAVTRVHSRLPWVYQGQIDPIDVDVTNEGDFNESVTVYAFYDGNQAAPAQTTALTPGQTQTLTFNWNTSGVPPGPYTVSANATIAIDDDPGDNTAQGNVQIVKPPLQFYWKPSYPDYARSGMPDFDQRQNGSYNWTDPKGTWSHCAPVAEANSLFWYDSAYENNTIGPPAMIDNFPLVTSYNPGVWDDHDPKNVQPLVEHLAYLMDTDGLRTGLAHLGTDVIDMQTGTTQYLSWSGVNPLGDCNGDGKVDNADQTIIMNAMGTVPGGLGWDMRADIFPVTTAYPPVADNVINANDLNLWSVNNGSVGMFYEHTMPAPDFYFIEEEVERCQDVVLLLGFYNGQYEREDYPYPFGHAVTVAGINSTTIQIAISDPAIDAFEAGLAPGRSPVPHPHVPPEPPYTLHNNASLVSHDIYNVTFNFVLGMWELVNYPGYPPPMHVVIENAVIVSPLEVEEVCGVEITDVVPWVEGKGMNLTTTAYRTWTIQVNVTVHNNGTVTTNCTVNAYAYNATNTYLIGTQNLTNLDPCNSTTLTFDWNVTGLRATNNYTVKANVTCPCSASDEFIDGQVRIRLWGDVDDSGAINILDLKLVKLVYSNLIVNPFADLDGNCNTNILDVKLMKLIYSNLLSPYGP